MIPNPLSVSYANKARKLETAQISVRWLETGEFEQKIVHGPLIGITREMLLWWMQHIGDQVEWEGNHVKAYRLWHPRDHIDWSCDGPVRPGCRFRIVEVFHRDRRFLIDKIFDVPKLDLSGFRIETKFYGIARISVDEDWEDIPGGVRWTNTMKFSTPLKGISRVAQSFNSELMTAWLTHNVEEVGFIPEFLPHLYDRK